MAGLALAVLALLAAETPVELLQARLIFLAHNAAETELSPAQQEDTKAPCKTCTQAQSSAELTNAVYLESA